MSTLQPFGKEDMNQFILQQIPGLPNVLAPLITEYEGRKYIRVSRPGLWDRLQHAQEENKLIIALYNQNIPEATEAIQKHGWSDKVYPHILKLAQANKWESVKFIFAQLDPNDPEITGSRLGPGQSGLNLGLPLSNLDLDYLPYFNPYNWGRYTWLEQNRYSRLSLHPIPFDTYLDSLRTRKEHYHWNLYYKLYQVKDSTSPLYFDLIKIWKIYHPLPALTKYNSFDGSLLFSAAVRSRHPDYRLTKLFFEVGLDPNRCWITYCPENKRANNEERQIESDDGILYKIHLAAWSASILHTNQTDPDSTIIAQDWLNAGLSPDAFVIDEPNHKVTWLMTMLCFNNLKGAELLLKRGANPNTPSHPISESYSSRLLYVKKNAQATTPLAFAHLQTDMVALLTKYGAK